MATINWTLTEAMGKRGMANLPGSGFIDSGSFTSSGTAGNITSLSPSPGQVLRLYASAGVWINPIGTAAAGAGFYVPAGGQIELHMTTGSVVSAIDA